MLHLRTLVLALVLALAPQAWLAAEDAPASAWRILIVHESDSMLYAVEEITRGLRQGFSDVAPTAAEFYPEHLDTARFPSEDNLARLADHFEAKYRDVRFDLVLVTGPSALRFMTQFRARIAPGAPMVVGGISSRTVEAGALPHDAWGVVSEFDARGTVDLAISLQPTAESIVVFTGSAEFDRSWQAAARTELGEIYGGRPVSYVSELTLEGFKDAAAQLPRQTILLILTVYRDASDRTFVPRDAASEIAAAAGAPSYGVYGSFIGAGIVGGMVETFDGMGRDMSALAIELLTGRYDGAQVVRSSKGAVLDWRQLQRWGIDEENVPAGTELRYFDPPLWQRYSLQIGGALALILLQAATIVSLIVVDRRRRRVERERTEDRLQLAHLSRATQLGELSGSFAHELNQPLTSILANAEAGRQLLTVNRPDLEEVDQILADIAADDRRAASVIAQLRRLARKDQIELETIDLNEVVSSTTALLHSEMISRRTRIEFRPLRKVLPVKGHFAQLQQVVMNLAVNAADAMCELEENLRRIEIDTNIGENGERFLSVTDSGAGLPEAMKDDVFKPFMSSKETGMGLGLPICRSIARAHGGTLHFEKGREKGARVVLTLPPP